jgi:hypothetical protein
MGGRLSKSANKPAITQRGARTARWAVRRLVLLFMMLCVLMAVLLRARYGIRDRLYDAALLLRQAAIKKVSAEPVVR